MIRGARLELGERAGHREREGLHLADLLPVLLSWTAVTAVLMEGVQVIAFHRRAGPIRFGHTPRQHDTSLTGHQLQLRLLRRGRPLCFRRQAGRRRGRRERGQGQDGRPAGRARVYRSGLQGRILQDEKRPLDF